MGPLISVIVPVYNGQDYLENCIERIEKQSYQPLEVIIINDGSTDRTAEICDGLKERYGNIRVITMNDEGVSAARNAGIDEAEGEYLTFVDADDRLLPRTIQLLYEKLAETGSDIAGCGFEAWSNEQQWKQIESRELARTSHSSQKEELRADEERVIYSKSSFITEGILKGNSRCWSKLYRRSAIGNIRFRQGLTIGEDMLFLVDVLTNVEKIVEISYRGYGYFQNPKGAMNRAFLPQYMDQITCWEIARKKLVSDENSGKEMAAGKEAEVQLKVQITAILIMAIMLTVGKLSLLSAKERRKQKQYVKQCYLKLKAELQVPGVYERLSRGYQIKVKLFSIAPELYLWLYHFRKHRK